MKSKMFRDLLETEKRAKLLAVLANKTEGKLSKEQLETIVNNIDISAQYKIKVINNAQEFNKECILENDETSHSWAGGDGTKETSNILMGKVEFGEDYSYEYFDNGNSTGIDRRFKVSNFDINETIIILKDKHEWYNWEGDAGNYDDWESSIIIYLPGDKSYEYDDKVKYILDNFYIK